MFLVTASGLLGKLILDPIFGFHGFIRKQPLSLCILAGPITGSTIIYRRLTSFVNPVAAGGILQQSLVSSALGKVLKSYHLLQVDGLKEYSGMEGSAT